MVAKRKKQLEDFLRNPDEGYRLYLLEYRDRMDALLESMLREEKKQQWAKNMKMFIPLWEDKITYDTTR